MGAGCFLGMEPPVGSIGDAESKLVILQIVLSDIDIISVLSAIVTGAGLFRAGRALFFCSACL